MPIEKTWINIDEICALAEVTLSDVSRIASVSRTTLYSLQRGDKVRRSTVIRILRSILLSKRSSEAHIFVRAELRKIGANAPRNRPAIEIIDALDDIVVDIATIADAPGPYDQSRLVALVEELHRIVIGK